MQRVIHTVVDPNEEPIRSSVVNRDAAGASISEIGRVSLARFAWFVVAYNVAVIVWDAYVRATGSGAVLVSADRLFATHHSGVTLSRKASTGVSWSFGFKGTRHISRGGGHSL